MRRLRTLLVWTLLFGILCACSCLSSGPQERGSQLPTTPADITGTVTSVSDRSIRVEVNPHEPSGSLKAQVTIPEGTPVTDRSGRMYDPGSIAVGSIVSVWFTGPVAESYPVQARARTVVLEERR